LTHPLISAIVPVYNCEKFIETCLESILAIDCSNLELIVIDDGSTDRSRDKIDTFLRDNSKRVSGYKFIKNHTNKGISYTKNIGLSKSTGKYFFIAGADDIQKTERVKIPLRYLLDNPDVDVVYFDCEIISENGSQISEKRGYPIMMNNENAILYQLMRNHFWSGMFLANSRVKNSFDQNLSSGVDYDWYFHNYFKNNVIHFIRDRLIKYRIHTKNTSNNYKKSSENVLKILNKYDFKSLFSVLMNENNPIKVKIAFAWYYLTVKDYESSLQLAASVQSLTDTFERNFIIGICFYLLNDFEVAQEKFENLYSENPSDCSVINNLAVCLSRTNSELEDIKSLLNLALDLNPHYLDAKNNLKDVKDGKLKNLRITKKPLRDQIIHAKHYLL
jgi:glycosyltransferase involved in cell wall biosynthesis